MWFALGFVLIAGIDYVSNHRKSWISVGLLSLVFGLHALVDGVALGTQADGMMLAIAIVAHRLPEGLALAGKADNNFSKGILFAIMTLTSVLGYFSVQAPLVLYRHYRRWLGADWLISCCMGMGKATLPKNVCRNR